MKFISSLIRNVQAGNARRVKEMEDLLKPDGLEYIHVTKVQTARVDLVAGHRSRGSLVQIPVRISASFHGPTVSVVYRVNPEIQSRIARAITLKLDSLSGD